MAASTFMTQGWSAKASSSSPWNAGILIDVPAVINQYPPGLGYGAWRAASSRLSSLTASSIDYNATGSKRSRPSLIRSNRRAPPPPSQSRAQPVTIEIPSADPFADDHSVQNENNDSSNLVLYKSSNNYSRTRVPSQSQSQTAGHTYPTHSFQSVESLARQRAIADREARSKVVASILLNRVNVVGKPMRRRARNGMDGQKCYVRSTLGRCITVAEC